MVCALLQDPGLPRPGESRLESRRAAQVWHYVLPADGSRTPIRCSGCGADDKIRRSGPLGLGVASVWCRPGPLPDHLTKARVMLKSS